MGYLGTDLDRSIVERWGAPGHLVQRRRPLRPDELGRLASSPQLEEQYVQVDGVWVPKENVREDALVALGARSHPRGLAYDLDAVTRARMCHLRHPGRVMAGWTAAGEWGLDCFVDDADTTVLAGGVSRVAQSATELTRRRRTRAVAQIPTCSTDPEFPDLRVTAPVLTLIHCLQSVWSGGHAWAVPAGTGLSDVGTRAVQLVDAMTRRFGVDPRELPAACAHHLSRETMETVVGWCDHGAESPMETVMRLMVRKLLRGTGLAFGSQMVVHADGSVVTSSSVVYL